MEILIGRQVGGENYNVDAKYTAVSRVHAKLKRQGDGFYIEDLDSGNGVYVNGCRVRAKIITRSDKVFLGGPDHCPLNLAEIIRMFPLSDDEFNEKIHELKLVYENYKSKSNELQSSGQESMMTKRMLPTMVLGTLTTILTISVGDDINTKFAIGIIGAILSVLVFFAATKWATKSNKEMKRKLDRLNEEFELNYVCPNCGGSYRNRAWESIRRMGECPACRRKFNLEQ